MLFKILIMLSAVFIFVGIYNLTWKTSELYGIPYKYRRTGPAWFAFGLALVMGLVAFLIH